MLVAAMNPCPCGYLGHPRHGCSCSPGQVLHYRSRISGPLLDRIDLHVDVPAVAYAELSDERSGEPSAAVRARVQAAQLVQAERFAGSGIYRNSQMSSRMVREHCVLEPGAHQLLETVVDRLGMSARAYDRILKVARSIADLAGEDVLTANFVGEAIQYRSLDRKVV